MQREFRSGIEEFAVDKCGPVGGRVDHIEVASCIQFGASDFSIMGGVAKPRDRRGQGGGDVEDDRFPVGSLVPHLELALDDQHVEINWLLGEHQDRGTPIGNLREIGVELGTELLWWCSGEKEFADKRDLSVSADFQFHVAGCDSPTQVQLGAAGDDHRSGERGTETGHVRVCLDGLVLSDHLSLDHFEPVASWKVSSETELRTPQVIRVVDVGQCGKELDTSTEVVDRQADLWNKHDSRVRQRCLDLDSQRSQFRESQPDRESTGSQHLEAAVNSHEENAILDFGCRVKGVDQVVEFVDLENPANQAGVEFSTEHLPLYGNANRLDVGDREFAVE